MRESTTRVPELLAGLVAVAGAALPGVWVRLGPPGAADVPDEAVIVGYHDGQPAVTVSVERAQGAGARLNETAVVGCGLSVSSGETDFAPLVERARAMLAAITDAIKADVTVGGAVDLATLGADVSWALTTTPQGADVTVWFTIAARALL